jgi:flagellin-specific chaperone FliS
MNDACFDRSPWDDVDAADDIDDADDLDVDPAAHDEVRDLLLDAALASVRRARRALGHSRPAISAMGLAEVVRARRTIDELRVRARVRVGDDDPDHETAQALVSLYEFCSDRLAHAAHGVDPGLLAAVEDVLTELRAAYG